MNTATRDAEELTATGPGGAFDVRPYWYADEGGTHSYPMFRDWGEDRPPRGYTIHEREQQAIVGDFMDMWHATIEAERLAAGD